MLLVVSSSSYCCPSSRGVVCTIIGSKFLQLTVLVVVNEKLTYSLLFYDRWTVKKREQKDSWTVWCRRWQVFFWQVSNVSEHSVYLSPLLCWLLRLLGGSTWLLAGSQADSFLARGDRSNYSCETYLAINKIQKYSFLSMSTTLLSRCKGWLGFSVAHGFSKVRFLHAVSRMVNYCSTVMPIN